MSIKIGAAGSGSSSRSSPGGVVFLTSQHYTPTADDLGRIFVDIHGNAYAVDAHDHPSSPAAAVFSDPIAVDTQFEGSDGSTRLWKGVHHSHPNVSTTIDVHSFYYRTSSGQHGFFEQVVETGALGTQYTRWISLDPAAALPASSQFFGEFQSTEDAVRNSLLAVGSYIVVGTSLLRVDAYSAAVLPSPATFSLRKIGQTSPEYIANLLNGSQLLDADALSFSASSGARIKYVSTIQGSVPDAAGDFFNCIKISEDDGLSESSTLLGDTYIFTAPLDPTIPLGFIGFRDSGGAIVYRAALRKSDGSQYAVGEVANGALLQATLVEKSADGTADIWRAVGGGGSSASGGVSQATLEAYIDSVVRNDTHYQLRLNPQAGTPTSTTDGNRATFANLNSAGRFTYHFDAGAQREPVVDVLVENNQPLVLTRLDAGAVRDSTRQLTGVARPGEGITFRIPAEWGFIQGFDLTHVEQGAFEVYEVRAYNDIQLELHSLANRIGSESRRANARFIYRSQSATSRPVVPSQFTVSSNGLIGWTQPTDSDGNAVNWAASSAGLPASGHALWVCMLWQDRNGTVQASPPFISSARGPQGITLLSFDSDTSQLRAHTPVGDGVTSTFSIDLSSLAGDSSSGGGGGAALSLEDTWEPSSPFAVPPNQWGETDLDLPSDSEVEDSDLFILTLETGPGIGSSGTQTLAPISITGKVIKSWGQVARLSTVSYTDNHYTSIPILIAGNTTSYAEFTISRTTNNKLAVARNSSGQYSLDGATLWKLQSTSSTSSTPPTGQFQLVTDEPEAWATQEGDRALVISGTQHSSLPVNEIVNGVHAHRYQGASTLYDYPAIDNSRLSFTGGDQAIGFDFGGERWPDKFIIAFKLYITAFPTAVCDILWGDRPIAPSDGGWSFNLDSTGRIHVQFGSSNASRMTTSSGIDLNTEYRIAVGFERNTAGNWELNYNINGGQRTSTTLTRTNDVKTEIIVGRSERTGTDFFEGFIYDLVVAETQRSIDHSVTDPFGQADDRNSPYGYLSRVELLREDGAVHGTAFRREYTGADLTSLQAGASGAFSYDPRDGHGRVPGGIFFRATPTPDTVPEEDISIFLVDGAGTGRLFGSQSSEGHYIPVGALNEGILKAYVRNESSTTLTQLTVDVQPYGTQNGEDARRHLWLKNVSTGQWSGVADRVYAWEGGAGDIYLSDLEYLEVSGQAGHAKVPPAIIYPSQIVQRDLTQSRAAMSRKSNDLYVQGWTPADAKIGLGTIDNWAISNGVATSIFRFVSGASSPAGTIRYLHCVESHNSSRSVLGIRAVFKPGVRY